MFLTNTYSLLQWVVLTRKHAKVIVNDTTVFPMFELHCRVSVIIMCVITIPYV